MPTRHDPEEHLDPLKPFQRRTVEHVFGNMYGTDDPQERFLIADEVGLGKTLVARGIISKATKYLWDKVERVDVVYICSNASIARQNINRLNIMDENERAYSSRLTMLPAIMDDISENKFNLVAFTPGTSLNLASSTGRMEERRVLYHMLKQIWEFGSSVKYMNMMQCGVQEAKRWRRYLKRFTNGAQINQEIQNAFADSLLEKPALRDKFEEAADLFPRLRRKSKPPKTARDKRNQIIGKLRKTLARTTIDFLTPDLIVLDEFQRFRDVLDDDDDMARLARRLFEYENKEEEVVGGARVLLLSATPYKMYTMHQEELRDTDVEHHQKDFFRTLQFLFENRDEVEELRGLLNVFKNSMFSQNHNLEHIQQLRERIERQLRSVMIRNERFRHIEDPEGMIKETKPISELRINDVKDYQAHAEIGNFFSYMSMMEYWKSAPNVISFMDQNYKLKDQLMDVLEESNGERLPDRLFKRLEQASFDRDQVNQYRDLDPENARLRSLIENVVHETDAWRLMWVPPSKPYYKSLDPYDNASTQSLSKSLIFSSWRVVPKVISMITSYIVEKEIVGDDDYTYAELNKSVPTYLRFTVDEEGRPQNLGSMSLFYPCWTLASEIDLLSLHNRLRQTKTNENQVEYREVFNEARARVKHLLRKAGIQLEERTVNRGEEVHFWKLMLSLDRYYQRDAVAGWLRTDEEDWQWKQMFESRGEGTSDFALHVNHLRDFFENSTNVETTTYYHLDQLTHLTLSAPATVCLRSLLRFVNPDTDEDRQSILAGAARMAMGFRNKFNRPLNTLVIRKETDEKSFWLQVLEYCRSGNLQSMMDEYIHVLVESEGVFDAPTATKAEQISKLVHSVLSIRSASLRHDQFQTNGQGESQHQRHEMRTHFALQYGDDKEVLSDDISVRRDIVRNAFNSPFEPFVLSTTSVGQEGLDFHLYCHNIYHWNLPSNPVDLEQREGRINRYKCHMIRKNIAKDVDSLDVGRNVNHSSASRQTALPDPWRRYFAMAEKDAKKSNQDADGLKPCWIYIPQDQSEPVRINRYIPLMPYSREEFQIERIKRSLIYYRMAFGQPRQEDLLEYLMEQNQELSREEAIDQARKYSINLSPIGVHDE